VLVAADIFDALAAKCPYREALPLERVFAIIRKDVPHALDADCFAALEQSNAVSEQSFKDLYTLSANFGKLNSGSRAALPAYSIVNG
jgi:HD-GYP domain-containing protein (c-di-GMP phosphodiesterase class II)